MRPESIHLLLEYWDCDRAALDDLQRVEVVMCEAARAAGASVRAQIFKPFEPQGVSGVVVIEESHLSIHTWPEVGYAAVDVLTCGKRCDPHKAHQVLVSGLKAGRYEMMEIRRGLSKSPSMRVVVKK